MGVLLEVYDNITGDQFIKPIADAMSVRYAVRWLRPARWADAVAALGADVAAIQQRLARAGVLAECRHSLRTMVWTVTGDASLRRWLASAEVDVIVTDRPCRPRCGLPADRATGRLPRVAPHGRAGTGAAGRATPFPCLSRS
ncbi:MAG: hypothetical protein ACRDOK_22175 [Streptosporangiaceae bacterium]